MVRVKMLSNRHGAPEGHTVHLYEKGEEYHLPESLASSFVENKAAEVVDGETAVKAKGPHKNKAETAPENK